MDRSGTNESLLDFSLTWESPLVNEIIPTLALPHVCFIFLSLLEFLCEMLEAVDTACLEGHCVACVLCMALDSVLHFSTAVKKPGEQ